MDAQTTAEDVVAPELVAAAADPATPANRLVELAQHPQIAPIVAANPGTPAEVLRAIEARIVEAAPIPIPAAIALMTHGTPTVTYQHYRNLGLRADNPTLAALARNPNTPTDTLLRLAGVFPAEFCANPIFPLLLLENPNLPGELPLPTVRSLLRYAGVPRGLLEWLVAYGMPDVAAAARLHINLAGDSGVGWEKQALAAIWRMPLFESTDLLLELLGLGAVPEWLLAPVVAAGDQAVRRAVARSPGTPKALLRPFRRAGASGDLAGYAPPDPALDQAVLAWLADGGLYARKLAACNPNTPPDLLDRLAADPDRVVRQFVAKNCAASAATLARLARDQQPDVRQLVARNRAARPDLLAELAGDRAKNVRWNVARNPNTPPDLLDRLAGDPERTVRQAVARNPAAPLALLERLADDVHPAVRAMVARNPHTPPATRARLLGDIRPGPEAGATTASATERDASIAGNASQPYNLEDLHSPDPAARARLAGAPGIPAPLLRQLAEDDHPSVRAGVAGNPGASPELLAWLAEDDMLLVHRAVAENPRTPVALLERFAADNTWSNMRVRLAVVAHPHVTPEILEHLAGDLAVDVRRAVMRHPLTPAHARARILAGSLETCTLSSESFYHIVALAHPAAPAAYLEARVGSPEWLERFAIARNPQAPRELLARLAEDGNWLVRAAARAAGDQRL